MLGEIWSEGSNLASLLRVEVLDIKSCQPWQKHSCSKKCWNSMADKHVRHVFYLQFMITIFQVYFLISVKEVILYGL